MNNQGTITNQEAVKEGDTVKVTSTVEEVLTRQDILIRLDNSKRQREGLAKQSRDIKVLYDNLLKQETNLNEMLALLPEEESALETL